MVAALVAYRYWVLAPLALIEGPLVALGCGVAASLGFINPVIAWGMLVAGDLIPDLMYYSIGRHGSEAAFLTRWKLLRNVKESLESLSDLWHRHGLLMMINTKLAYGLSAPLIVSAGIVRLPLSTFVRYSLAVSGPFLASLVAAGYYLTSYYAALKELIENAEVFLGVGAALILLVLFFGARYFRSNVRKLVERKNTTMKEPPVR